jgi:hypothetical protein
VPLGGEASSGGSQLEGPQEVVCLLEVLANGLDFVDEVFHGVDVLLSEGLAHDLVAGEGDSLLVDLAETALEDQLSDGFPRRIAESDVGLHSSEQVGGGLVNSHEDSVVDLSQSKDPEDSEDLGVELVNTSDPDDEGELGLGGDVDLSGEFGLSGWVGTCLRAVISLALAFW